MENAQKNEQKNTAISRINKGREETHENEQLKEYQEKQKQKEKNSNFKKINKKEKENTKKQ